MTVAEVDTKPLPDYLGALSQFGYADGPLCHRRR